MLCPARVAADDRGELVCRRVARRRARKKVEGNVEPELGARVRYRGRTGRVTQKQLTPNLTRHGNNQPPSPPHHLVLFLEPDAGRRGEELRLYEPEWDELEPTAE
jgi:hypothetical protein